MKGQHSVWTLYYYCTYNSMPVELTERALFQVLLSCCDVRAGRDIGHDLLTSPATVVNLGLGVGEAPFQVHN
jgi:hypothetical protein